MRHWEQDWGKNQLFGKDFFRNRVDTNIVLHQSGCGKVFLAYQGFGAEENED